MLAGSPLGKELFWEAEYAELDWDKNASYIIPRVMDYGTLEDVRCAMQHYGKERIRAVLHAAPALQSRTIHFFASYFSEPLDNYLAYNLSEKNQWQR